MSIELDVAVPVAADEVRAAQHVLDAWPAMGVYRRARSDWDVGVEHTHPLVLEQEPRILGRRPGGVQLVWPTPAVCLRGYLAHPDPPLGLWAGPDRRGRAASPGALPESRRWGRFDQRSCRALALSR